MATDDIPHDIMEGIRVSNVFGTKRYWKNGKVHREGGPAVIYANGDLGFFKEGLCHRLDGPAFIAVSSSPRQEWWREGKLHREDGPAIIYDNGQKEWYLDGKRHRTDGPALITADGIKEFWVYGKRTTEDKMADQKMGDQTQKTNLVHQQHPFTQAFKKAKEAREFSWKRPLKDRYDAYLEAAAANREAARYCGTAHQLYAKYDAEANDLEKDAADLKIQFRHYFANLVRKKPIVLFTKRELAKELTQAALRGYFGVNSFYDVSHGLGKKAVDSVYDKLDELMSKLYVGTPTDDQEVADKKIETSPDVKELQDKSKSSDIQTIQDPTITITVEDLPSPAPVQDLNVKPFEEPVRNS